MKKILSFLKSLFFFFSKDKSILLSPGPVMLQTQVRKTLSKPMIHHRSSEFEILLKETSSRLKKIFQTQAPVLILTSTGTGAMEAAISNTLSPEEEILCICGGKFGERWRDIAQAFKLKVHTLNVPYGEAVCPQALKQKLEGLQGLRAVLVSACETSTGTEHPIQEISKILKNKPEILFIVDGVTGVGAMNLPMQEWGIDILIASSQKNFMLPTGLSFISLSQKAWEANKTSSCPKYYFDLKREKEAQVQGQTSFSSSVTLVRALKNSLDFIENQGLNSCILRCQSLKKSTQIFCESLDLKLFSSKPANAITAIQIPEGLSTKKLKEAMEKTHKVIVSGGQGILKNKILRVGHLGFIKNKDHLKGLKALAVELRKLDPNIFSKEKIKVALNKAKKILIKI